MAFSIALWIRDTALKLRQQGLDLNRKTMDYFGKGSASSLYNPSMPSRNDTGWTMDVGKDSHDITWLL
jgi:hypothetical protein